jgi:transcriptional regulator with XRE-family HTH domain
MMEDGQFGLQLKQLRQAAGLTQPQLAAKAGLSKAGVADLEQGRNDPSWATVTKLAAALGVDCRAFQETPTVKPASRGRPRKADAKPARKRPKK